MYIVMLDYQDVDAVDRLMGEHVRFLEECFRAEVFLAAGRRNPRTGGVILALAPGREDLEEIMAHDPIVREGAATFEIVEFRTSLHHPVLEVVADDGTRTIRPRD